MTDQEKQKIIELHLSGMPLHELAEEMGYSLVTLKRRISEIRKSRHLPWRSKSKNKCLTERMRKDDEETPWNLELSRLYLTKSWGM